MDAVAYIRFYETSGIYEVGFPSREGEYRVKIVNKDDFEEIKILFKTLDVKEAFRLFSERINYLRPGMIMSQTLAEVTNEFAFSEDSSSYSRGMEEDRVRSLSETAFLSLKNVRSDYNLLDTQSDNGYYDN